MSEIKIKYISNKNGPEIGYCGDSGLNLIERDGLCFKDHSKSGELLPYVDWRLVMF